MEYSNLFVCLMGICTVFIGLICIIILVSVMSGIVRKTDKRVQPAQQAAVSAAPSLSVPEKITPQMVAAISAAIAQELGTDVEAIRILSIKKA